jgi:thioester reductase-like protein/SAM-dependent methyltransferase
MSRARATYASSPNFGFEYCLREDKVPSEHLDKLDLSSLRVLMTASEPVRVDTYVRFLERFARCGLQPRAHVSAYGLAENTLAVTNYGRRTLAVDRRLLQRGVVSMERARPVNGNQLHLLSCGKPLDGIGVRIVHPDSRVALGEQRVGEIWVSGKSVGKGYWNRPGLTRQIFDNTVANDRSDRNRYLRTGDLGFIHEEELFVCGRIKDIIIIRGLNYHPHDIEAIVEQASQAIRPGGVAAFDVAAEEGGLIVMAEVRSVGIAPEPAVISRAIRRRYHIEPGIIVFVPPRTIARTTSGKIARSLTRARWRNGELPVLATHVAAGERAQADCVARLRERLEDMVDIHDLADREECTLAEIGIDSLNAVVLLADLKSLLEQVGAGELARELDGRLLQRLTIVELFSLLDRCENAPGEPAASVRDILARIREEQDTYQRDCMRDDAGLAPMGHLRTHVGAEPLTGVLLTGATGFFGPFLLRSLLRKTPYTYYVLTRASGPAHALDRVRAALRRAGIWTPALDDELDKRVHVVCGDLAQPDLGMNSEDRTLLTSRAQAVCHNAAMVNYVLNYDALKPHNVDGTRELLRLCFTGTPKEFHLISSTFIFGWSVKDILWETDDNADMANLDFGYAQSKWVAEQLALAAERQGLKVRIYRPSLISASADAIGSRDDIAIRLLAFMINQGLAVNARNQISFLPADITADSSYNMMDITRLITDAYGYHFSYHEIPRFISEMNRLCTPSDPLYPLLDFFNFSYPKISAMQHKRYDNSRYREARRQTGIHRDDPSLQETLSCMIAYMIREGLIPSAGAELRRGRRGRSAPPFPTEVGQVRLRPP